MRKPYTDGKYKKENLHQKEAFELYYSLGESRTLDKVAELLGRNKRTLYEWSTRFNWQERVLQYDIEISKKLKEKTVNTIANEKANYRKIIKLAISDFVKRLSSGEIKVATVAELEKLIKMDLVLMGEADEIKENRGIFTEEDRQLLQVAIDKYKRDLEE